MALGPAEAGRPSTALQPSKRLSEAQFSFDKRYCRMGSCSNARGRRDRQSGGRHGGLGANSGAGARRARQAGLCDHAGGTTGLASPEAQLPRARAGGSGPRGARGGAVPARLHGAGHAGFRGGVRALARRPRPGRGRPCPHGGQTLGRLPTRAWRQGDPRGRRPGKSADAAGKKLPTLSIDTEIRFRSAAERAAFTRDLAEAVATLGARYHDESAPGGRWSRLVVLAHPRPASDESGTTAPAAKEAT